MCPSCRACFGGGGKGILTASILLGIMILPTIIGVSESNIRAVPMSYYEGSLGLGATHERSVFFAVLPAAKQGILAGVVLGIGRAVGETMAVVMIAGNQPILPDSIFSGVRTMTANIVMEMGYATDLHREALLGTAVVLFVFILIINLSFSLLKRRADLMQAINQQSRRERLAAYRRNPFSLFLAALVTLSAVITPRQC